MTRSGGYFSDIPHYKVRGTSPSVIRFTYVTSRISGYRRPRRRKTFTACDH